VRVGGHNQTVQVEDLTSLEAVLARRDHRGGGLFWLTPDGERFPALAVRVSGDLADVHYFPWDGHPGFRCLAGDGLSEGGLTTLVFEGCDPASGEDTPNEFIVPFETARSIAKEFFHSRQMSEAVSWFEL
jgi:Immunity protein Imm1